MQAPLNQIEPAEISPGKHESLKAAIVKAGIQDSNMLEKLRRGRYLGETVFGTQLASEVEDPDISEFLNGLSDRLYPMLMAHMSMNNKKTEGKLYLAFADNRYKASYKEYRRLIIRFITSMLSSDFRGKCTASDALSRFKTSGFKGLTKDCAQGIVDDVEHMMELWEKDRKHEVNVSRSLAHHSNPSIAIRITADSITFY